MATQAQQQKIVLVEDEIVDGPGKWDFVMGLFEGHRLLFHIKKYLSGLRAPVFNPIIVDLQGARLESGGTPRDNWLIEGDVIQEKWDRQAHKPKPYDFEVVGRIEGYYNTRTRKGNCKITPRP